MKTSPTLKSAAATLLLANFLIGGIAGFSASAAPLSTQEKLSQPEPIFDSSQLRTLSELDPLLKRLATVNILRAQFRQKKHISALTRPLLSSGSFFFSRQLGISWKAESPFTEQFVISEAGLMRKEPGAKTIFLNAAEHPAIRGFTQVFLALFKSDLKQISQNFDFFSSSTVAPWELGLRSKGSEVPQFIRAIELSGNSYVEKVLLHEANGDKTEIEFSDFQILPETATALERDYFEP